MRQTSSNPWFLFNQDILALKDAKGNKIYSDYGDARARVVAWRDMPVRLRALLGDVGPARWLQHPFSVKLATDGEQGGDVGGGAAPAPNPPGEGGWAPPRPPALF